MARLRKNPTAVGNFKDETEAKTVTKKALVMRNYRMKLKTERITKYNETKEKDRQRKVLERTRDKQLRNKSTQKQDATRKAWAEQKRKYRQKLKEKSKERVCKSTPNHTHKKVKVHRLKHLLTKKSKQAAVARTKIWRMRINLKETEVNDEIAENETIPSEKSNSAFKNRMQEHRVYRKVTSAMPGTPKRKARIVEKLASSPRTSSLLQHKGYLISKTSRKQLNMGQLVLNSLKKKIESVKAKGTVHTEKKAAYNNLINAVLDKSITRYHKFGTAISYHLKVRKPSVAASSDWWKTHRRRTRKDRLHQSVRDKVQDFFLSPSVSRENPNKKDVLNENGELIQQHIMTMTLKEAYDRFKKENPDIKVGLTSFKKEKPKNVKVVNETSHKACLCQICCNLALKIDHLKKFAEETKNENLKEKLQGMNKSKLSNITLCEYTDLPSPQCLDRSCTKCGAEKVKDFLKHDILTENVDMEQASIKWYRWEGVQVMDANHDKVKRVTSCVPKTSTADTFLDELSSDLEKYPSHMFRANWQHKELQNCINNLTDGRLVMMMDFSENYRCRFQNESQSGYFDQIQATVHPFMCYYLDKKQNDNDQRPENESAVSHQMVKHSVIVVSNDVKHDAFAVKKFEKEALSVLNEETEIKELIKFSDGSAAQYKGKNSFAHISKSEIPVTANFFETSHGKSPCDGLGAVLKNACFNAVKSQKAVIGNAKDAYNFSKQKLEHTRVVKKGEKEYVSKRNILYVDRSEVEREELGVKTLSGTRNVHAVKSINTPFSVQARNLSCFCTSCVENKGTCENKLYVLPWSTHNLFPVGQKKTNQPASKQNDVNNNETGTFIQPTVPDTDQLGENTEPEVGGFVLVHLTKQGRGRAVEKDFVARVLDIDGDEIKLTYMSEKIIKAAKFYFWPADEDVSWEEKSKIVRVVPEPVLSTKSTSRNILFTL